MLMSMPVRRLIVIVITGLMIALIALSLRTSSSAMRADYGQIVPSLFASPIDPPSTIQGTVFEDVNGNGEQDAGEPGIQGVMVKLEDGISGTITTGPNGDYSFSLGWSGYYTVTAMTPTGYMNTTPEVVVAHLTGSSQEAIVDFGYRGIGTIRGTVFDDRNINGMQDEGEPGISGVSIALLQDDATIDTTTTDEDGSYAFTSVLLGDYLVEETDLPGYTSETPNVRPVSLTSPGEEETVTFADYGPSRVTGIVFNDIDGDGSKDGNERGIPGVPIDLLFEGTVEVTKTTDSNGVYFFLWEGLDPGTYTVRERNLEGYISITDDEVEVSHAGLGQVDVVDFADRGVGIIDGTVFNDENGNQELDSGETGIGGVTISLFQDDTMIRTTSTASDGYYEFIALGLDDYVVQETDLEGYDSTTPNVVTVTLTTSRHQAEADFGDRGIGTIRGTVFNDQDGNQEQDVGEAGIQGVTVRLLQEGSPVFTTTTSGGGVYEFDPVWLGEYTVHETDPEGYVSTTENTATVSLTMTQQVEVRNFGDRGVGTIQGTVFSDENGNEEQDEDEQGIPGVTITILQDGSVTSTTTTASDGSYRFTSQLLGDYTVRETNPEGYTSTTADEVEVSLTAPGQQETVDFGDRRAGAIEGIVFSDDNGNEEQDTEEQGIPGVTISLRQDNSTITTTTTASDGTYRFDPVWLGEYTVEETDPNGYVSTTPNEVTVSLTTTSQIEVIDFGNRGAGTIRGTVFNDKNGDGIQNGGEPGVEGVAITVLQDSSSISTTMTASDGSYTFAPLFLGDYTVRETNPDGYRSTTDDEVAISLTTPGQQETANFGDRRGFIYLPLVAKGRSQAGSRSEK